MHPSAFMGAAESADPLYRRLAEWVPADGSVLDLGSGRGRWLDFARDRGARTTGVDSHAGSVDSIRARGHDAHLATVTEFLACTGSRFDLVSAFHLVEHLAPPEVESLLDAVTAVLRPNGRVVLVTPNFADWSVASEMFWLDPTHVRPYPPALLRSYLGERGYRVLACRTVRWVRTAPREQVGIRVKKLRFGREYGRMNSVVVGELG